MLVVVLSFSSLGNAQSLYEGAKFGAGLSTTIDFGKDRVDDASLDNNGVVRVSKSNNYITRLLLETHTFWEVKPRIGIGPFCAISVGGNGNDLLVGMGTGIMMGMKTGNDSKSDSSFNIGLGVFIDPYTKTLGDGIEENELLPQGESQIRYRYKSQGGILLLFSYAW
jgi:hypothetical protein